MKLKFAIAAATAAFFVSATGVDAVTLPGSNQAPAIQTEVVKAGCVGGRRCAGGYYYRGGVRVCRSWVACR